MSRTAPPNPTANGTVRAGIYARISRDDAGDMAGVRRQERDCRRLCAAKGWSVADVYCDDDVSAWSGKRRPEYRRLLDDLAAGTVNAVVTYDLDRLHRQPRELEAFFDIYETAGIKKMASVAGDIDLGDSNGRLLARLLGATAAKSSDDTSRRLRRKSDELAEQGLPHGGQRAYGWRDSMHPDPVQAEIVRELVGRVIGGESFTALARDLNDRGVPSATGKRWAARTVQSAVTCPRHAGLRRHRGEVVGDAAWEAIIPRADYERVLAALADPARPKFHPSRRGLLTGFLRCGRCGGAMFAAGVQFRCENRHVAISRPHVEEWVVELVFARLDTAKFADVLDGTPERDDDGATVELADAEHRLGELASMWGAGEISRSEWLRARKTLEARRDAARGALARRSRTTAIDAYRGSEGALRAAWPEKNLDQRRAVLAAVLDRVEISPGRRGVPFDRDRVHPVWRI